MALGTPSALLADFLVYTQSNVQDILLQNNDHRKAHGDMEGQKISDDSSPLIKSASFSRNLGDSGRTLCAIGLAPPTSISHIAPRAAEGSAFR